MESIYEPIDGDSAREPRIPLYYTYPTRFNQEKYMPSNVLEKPVKPKKKPHDLAAAYGTGPFTDSTLRLERLEWILKSKNLEETAKALAEREIRAMRKTRRLAADLTQLIHSVDSIEELRAIITPKEGDSLEAYRNRIKGSLTCS